MTIQTVLLQTQDYGASLTSATLRNITTDTLEKTADSANEVTADGGLYALVFGEATVIPAGWYRVRAIIAGLPILRYVYLTGVDTETAHAVVDMPATTLIADAILSRDVSNVESTVTEHTLATAILSLLEWSISGGDLIIKRTDGSTVHFTKTLTSATGTGEVITGLN
jgi:hypothetical protein